MANIKISQLTAAASTVGTQEFEVNESGTSKKVTGTQIKTFVKDGLAPSDLTGVTATAAELNYTSGVTSAIQTQLDAKAPTGPAGAAALMGYTSTVTNAGATNLTNTSTQYQLFTGTLVQTIRLPTTSTLTTGWTFHIVNNSTANLTVNATGSSFVCTVLPNMTAMLTCISVAVSDNTAWEFGFTDFGSVTGTGSNVLSDAPFLTGNLSFNSGYGSSAVAYGCRAWAKFGGTGTISGSGNVSSVTNPSTGRYVVSFTTAMPDANYAVSTGGTIVDSTSNPWQAWGNISRGYGTGSFTLDCSAQGTTGAAQSNWAIVTVAVFR